MRIRTIKPDFWTSLSIVALPIRTRLHFIGLWNYADDEGRGLEDVRLLKAALWPLDDGVTSRVIRKMQAELEDLGLIVRYRLTADTEAFAITAWEEHQVISHPKPSKIAAPTEPEPSGPLLGSLRDRTENDPGPLPEESSNDPGMFQLESGGKGRERKGKEKPVATRRDSSNPVTDDELYLADRLATQHGRFLTPAALQRLNTQYGTPTVTAALRQLHGFPPEGEVRDVYSYVESLCALA